VVGIFAMFPACGSADGNLKRCVDYASPGKDSTPEINVKTVKGDGRLHPSRDNSRNPFGRHRSMSRYQIFHPADLLFHCNSLTSIAISLSLPSCRTEFPVRSAAAVQ
jgi:hypothetical protein